jgi:hypothetical protein
MFAGSDRGAENAATIIETAKANDLNPQAYIADLLSRLPEPIGSIPPKWPSRQRHESS